MDSITELIKNEIREQYGNLSKFAEASGIPYSTLSNALSKGIGGTSYDTVVRVFQLLKIRQTFEDDIILFNEQFHDIYKKLTMLDKQGVHTVCAVLNAEFDRCSNTDNDTSLRGFNGIGYVVKETKPFDEARIMKLVRKVQKEEKL